MKRVRDPDMIRNLMLEMEDGKEAYVHDPRGYEAKTEAGRADAQKLALHLELIQEERFVEFRHNMDMTWDVLRITSRGHDFLDSVRDPAIWAKTKDGAKAAGGFTLELLGALAKGFLKKQIQDRTGVELEF